MASLSTHEVTKFFPLVKDAEFDALVKDIDENGQRQPVLILDGKVIDGRNRLRACKKLKIEPKIKQIRGDALALVMSLNYHRRHLRSHEQGEALTKYLAAKGGAPGKAKGGKPKANGKPRHNDEVSVTGIADELGIPESTARKQIKAAETYAALPKSIQQKVDSGECPIEIAPKVATAIDRKVSKLHKPAMEEVKQIEKETSNIHKRINSTMKWLQSVESGCRFHKEFLSSHRWSRAELEIIGRVAKNMTIFARELKQ